MHNYKILFVQLNTLASLTSLIKTMAAKQFKMSTKTKSSVSPRLLETQCISCSDLEILNVMLGS